jgi:hypothetical protein
MAFRLDSGWVVCRQARQWVHDHRRPQASKLNEMNVIRHQAVADQFHAVSLNALLKQI